MYVRVFKADEIKRWNVKDIDDLPILALKLWNPKKDNDYSIFKFEDKKRFILGSFKSINQ